MNKKYLLLVILVFLLGQFVFANDDDDIEKQNEMLEEVEELLGDLDDDHQNYVNQKNTVIRNIRGLEDNIRTTEEEIVVLDVKIVDNKGLVAIAVIELDAAKVALQETNDLLDKRIRVMYKNGSVGYFEVLLEAKNFEDLLVRVDMLQRIVKNDTDLIVQMEDDQRNVEIKKADLETEQEKLISLQEEMDQQRIKLEDQVKVLEREKIALLQNIEAVAIQIDETNEDAEKIKEIIKDLELRAKYVGGSMTWPLPESKEITSLFGMRLHPILGVDKMHTGLDISVPTGSSVLAAQEGTVVWANWLGGYGKCIMIDHGGGILTLYAHNSNIKVRKGQIVKRNELIALSGNTGNSTGPHLHFEVRVDGEYMDPLDGWIGTSTEY